MVSIGLYFPPPFFCCCISLPLLISLCFPLGSVFRFGWISCRYLEISEASLMVSFCQYWASFSFPPFFFLLFLFFFFFFFVINFFFLFLSLCLFLFFCFLYILLFSSPLFFFVSFLMVSFCQYWPLFSLPLPPLFFCFVVSFSFLFTNVFASL